PCPHVASTGGQNSTAPSPAVSRGGRSIDTDPTRRTRHSHAWARGDGLARSAFAASSFKNAASTPPMMVSEASMIPTLVLTLTFVVLLALGRLSVPALSDWVICLRWSLAAMFLVTASAHFNSLRADL